MPLTQALAIAGFVGYALDSIGKLMVAYTAVSVHYRFWKEHKVDDAVFAEMHAERKYAIIGIIMMVTGFLLQIPDKLHIN